MALWLIFLFFISLLSVRETASEVTALACSSGFLFLQFIFTAFEKLREARCAKLCMFYGKLLDWIILFVSADQVSRIQCLPLLSVCIRHACILSSSGHCALPVALFLAPPMSTCRSHSSSSLSPARSRPSSAHSSSSSSSSSRADSSSLSRLMAWTAGGGRGAEAPVSLESELSSKSSGFSSISLIRGGMGPGISIFRVMARSAPKLTQRWCVLISSFRSIFTYLSSVCSRGVLRS